MQKSQEIPADNMTIHKGNKDMRVHFWIIIPYTFDRFQYSYNCRFVIQQQSQEYCLAKTNSTNEVVGKITQIR